MTPVTDSGETPDLYGAFPRLSNAQIGVLTPLGELCPTQPGELLYREGDISTDLSVVVRGKVAMVEGYPDLELRLIGIHGPGRFLGELSVLTGQALYVTAVVREPGEVLVVPVDRLREHVIYDFALGDVILRAYLLRRLLRLAAWGEH